MFENGVEDRLVVVLGAGLLHFQEGFAAPDLEARDVVVKPGRFVHEVPADIRLLDAGQSGERLTNVPATLCPPKAHGEAFREA
jgi:hypothetical protein